MNTEEAVRRLEEVVRRKHLALATERTYCAWLRRYCDFLKGPPLHLPSQHKLERFLTVLAQNNVAASTQNQAFNAIIFFKENLKISKFLLIFLLIQRSRQYLSRHFEFLFGLTREKAEGEVNGPPSKHSN